jgi:hypothetical protein
VVRKRLWRSTGPGWDQRAARRWAGGAAVARFEATPYVARKPLRVSVRHWPGALAGAPFADAAGYSFVLRGPEGALQLERRTELGLLSGELSDVGSVL